MKLYRVVDRASWRTTQLSGFVPRCNSDQRENHVYLKMRESVERVAAAYFEPCEEPLVLAQQPSDQKPWKQACAQIKNIPLASVMRVFGLDANFVDGKNVFVMKSIDGKAAG
ncbi:MAG: hypothetical protein VX768_21205 [Planctomycetota bacterium]|nr:hypothetical protein [Planctomycetota bacterium]